MVGGHSLKDENRLKTIAGLSNLWDAAPVTITRSGEGAETLYGRRLSLHLMMQPQVAMKLLGDGLLIDQGILSRCLVAWPESTAGSRTYTEGKQNDPAVNCYNERIRNLLETPPLLIEGTRNELNPRSLPLSESARKKWIEFYDHIERDLAADQPLASIRGFGSKVAEHALRIAGVIAIVDDPSTTLVDEPHIAAGIALAQFYLQEALRLFDSSAIEENLLLAEKLLDWAQKREIVYLRQIYQFGPNQIRSAAKAKEIAGILEGHGWFEPVKGGEIIDGAHRKTVWRVHP